MPHLRDRGEARHPAARGAGHGITGADPPGLLLNQAEPPIQKSQVGSTLSVARLLILVHGSGPGASTTRSHAVRCKMAHCYP